MNGEGSPRSSRTWHGSLAARGRPERTFGGLLGFVAILCLVGGVYLIAEPMIHPIGAHDAGVIVGACTVALAAILLFYLVKPRAQRSRVREEPEAEPATLREEGKAPARLTLHPVRLRGGRARMRKAVLAVFFRG
jgi:hypothetical protein